MVTLKDIAKRSGVSIGTASAVLNNKNGVIRVSPTTKEKVYRVAKRLNYIPNIAARGLRTGKSFLIGVLTAKITNSFVPEILQGIEDTLLHNNYSMILSTYHTPEDMQKKIDSMLQKNIDAAIVITDSRKEYCEKYIKLYKKIPFISIGEDDVNIDIPKVCVDGIQIGEIACEYLLKLGHTQIACIGYSPNRYQGFLNSLKKHEVKLEEDLQIHQCADFESGKIAIENYINKGKIPSAVICYSEEIAAGIIAGAVKHNIKIPDQLSIIGVNDTSIAKMLTPALTTVAQPKTEQGEQAVKLAINIINKLPIKTTKIILEPFLIKRESCKMVNSKN